MGRHPLQPRPDGAGHIAGALCRVVEQALGPFIRAGFVTAYIDDILVHSNSLEEHVAHLDQVFDALGKVGLRVSLSKSKLCRPSMDFLGYICNGRDIVPSPARVQGWASLAPPSSVKQMRTFIGVCSYLRDSLAHIEDRLYPYRKIIEGRDSGSLPRAFWSKAQLADFNAIKTMLTSTDALLLPDYNRPFLLRTDASDVALGGSVLQEDPVTGLMRPVAFFSHRFTRQEARWNVSEREMYAVVYGLTKFNNILKHAKIYVETDHIALTFLRDSPNPKISRWWLALSQYNIAYVRHISGESNVVADALSRLEMLDVVSHESVDPHQHWLLSITHGDAPRDDVIAVAEDTRSPDERWLDAITAAVAVESARPPAALPPHAQFARLLSGKAADSARVLPSPLVSLAAITADGDDGALHFGDDAPPPAWMLDDSDLPPPPRLATRGARDVFLVSPAAAHNVSNPDSAPAADSTASAADDDHVNNTTSASSTAATDSTVPAFDYAPADDPSLDPCEPPLTLSPEASARLSTLLQRVVDAQSLPAAAAQLRSGILQRTLVPSTRNGIKCTLRDEALWLPRLPETDALRADVLRLVHDAAGHRSASYLMKSLDRLIYWDGCRRDCVAYVATCTECARKTTAPHRARHGKLGNLPAAAPRECTAIDYLGPFTESTGSALQPTTPMKYVLSVQDVYSRFTCLYPCDAEDGETTVRILRHHFCTFGFSRTVRSDRGSHFANNEVQSFLQLHGIKQVLSPAGHPEGQATVERLHRAAIEMTRTYVRNRRAAWAYVIDSVQCFINSSFHRAIGCSPFEAFFGEPMHTMLTRALGVREPVYTDELKRLSALYALRDAIRAASRASTEAATAHANLSRRDVSLSVGDTVLIWRDKIDGKLDTHYDKLSRVSAIVSDTVVEVVPVGDSKPLLVHVDALKVLNVDRSALLRSASAAPLVATRVYEHRVRGADNLYDFLVLLQPTAGSSPQPAAWVPGFKLRGSQAVRDYCKMRNITQKAAFASSADAAAPKRRSTSTPLSTRPLPPSSAAPSPAAVPPAAPPASPRAAPPAAPPATAATPPTPRRGRPPALTSPSAAAAVAGAAAPVPAAAAPVTAAAAHVPAATAPSRQVAVPRAPSPAASSPRVSAPKRTATVAGPPSSRAPRAAITAAELIAAAAIQAPARKQPLPRTRPSKAVEPTASSAAPRPPRTPTATPAPPTTARGAAAPPAPRRSASTPKRAVGVPKLAAARVTSRAVLQTRPDPPAAKAMPRHRTALPSRPASKKPGAGPVTRSRRAGIADVADEAPRVLYIRTPRPSLTDAELTEVSAANAASSV